jgi:hypothetical protein
MPTGHTKTIRYPDGQDVRFGDFVLFGGESATVVAHAASSSYDPGFPRKDWEHALKDGFLLRFENGALLQLDDCDEDIQLLHRRYLE